MRLDYPNLLPECYVDTNLMQYLLNGTVNHQHSCTKVVGNLKNKFKDRFAVGVIDRDKVELSYIKECDVVAETEHLALLKHQSGSHYLITVAPAIDKFILDNAYALGIDTQDYDIPSDLKGFTTMAKRVTSNKDEHFKNLFVAMKTAPEFVALKRTIKYLLQATYQADEEKIKVLFSTKE